MCCGGGDAPAPDPLIGQAAMANAKTASEALDWYKSTYANEIAPRLKADQDLRTGLVNDIRGIMGKQQAFADEQNQYYKDTFQPVEKRMVEEASTYDSADNVGRRMGIASANVNQQFSNARSQGLRALSRFGVGINPDQFARENLRLSTQQALASSGAQTGAAFDTMDKAIAMRAGAANFGRNMPNTAATYYSGANASGGNASGISSGGISNTATGAGVMGQGFNTNIAGNQSAGNLMLGEFDSRMKGYMADQQASSGLMSGLGMLGGMALGAPSTSVFGSWMAKKADGGEIEEGVVRGPGGPRGDKIPVFLSDGEFVLNEGAVKHFGLSKLNKMNEVGLQNQRARGLIRRA